MKFLVILIFLLQQRACCQALDGPVQAPTTNPQHPSVGTVPPPDSGAAGEANNPSSPTHASSSQAGATAHAAPTAPSSPSVTAPDADAVCTAPTLGEWVLQRDAGRFCALHPDDDFGGVAWVEVPAAAVPAAAPGTNTNNTQPSREPVPLPEVGAELAEDEERQNFAAAKDGAKIVAANKEAKKAASLLDDDGDTFVKNECKADKWVIIETSQMIKVDTLKVRTAIVILRCSRASSSAPAV